MAEIQYLEINDITRMINVPANLLLGVREDKDVKKLYFKCKKIVEENVDLSKHQIYVKYINALDKSGKKFDIMDPKICLCGDVTAQGDYITFSWLMSENVFAKAGLIAFSILASDGEKTRWNTYTAIGTVLNSVPGGLQEIAGKYPDIITQLLNRMREVEKIATKEAMQEYVNTYLTEHPGEIDETLTDPKKAAPADIVGLLKSDLSQLSEEIENLDVRSIADIQKTASELLVDTYTITYTDGTSSTFQVTNGSSDEAYIASIIGAWLDEHPEATTTVQNGVVTYEKLADDVKEVIDKASKSGSGMTVSHYVGQLFDKSHFGEKPYVAWALGNTQYDKTDDTVNVLVNAADYHGEGSVTDLYLMKMNPHTLDYAMIPIVVDSIVANQTNPNEVTFPTGLGGAYTYGFCIDTNGDYLFMPNYCDVALLFRSSDHGTSWKVTTCEMPDINDYAFTGLMQTSTGRLIVSTNSAYFWYSDDDGATWTMCSSPTSHTFGHEAEIVELKENTLIAVMRRKWNDTDNNEYSGNPVIAPAVVSYSYDNGTTWTNPVESQSITEMSSTGCAIAKLTDEKLELYATSRYPHGDTVGVIYKHSATVDDALEDNWSSGKVVRYAKAIVGQDFGYPSCCVDSVGNTHLFYYDGDSSESASTNYYYIQSYQDINNVPINSDDFSLESPCIPYSAKKVNQLIKYVRVKLQAQIDKLIIQGGGTPEFDPDAGLDGSSLIYDGLVEFFDFTDSSLYNAETGVFTGLKGMTMQLYANEWNNAETELDFVGYVPHWAICVTEIDESEIFAFTVEILIEYQNVGKDYGIVYIGNNTDIRLVGNGLNGIKYMNTNGSTITNTDLMGSDNNCSIHGTIAEHHLVLTVAENEWSYYIDGELAKSIEVPSDFSAFASGYLGKFKIGDQSHARKLRFYSKALTKDEIKNNYIYETNLLLNTN